MKNRSFLILSLAAVALTSCQINVTTDSSSGKSSSAASSANSSKAVSSTVSSLTSSSTTSSSSQESSSSSAISSVAAHEVRWITPTGAPTLAFYDQGANEDHWISSASPATEVAPAFATDNYDAVVFDGVSALNLISKNSYNYQLASWISGGNFYLVSTKHSALSDYAAGQTVESFVKTGNASRSFLKLAADKWSWSLSDSDVHYEGGVADVKTALVSNPTAYDYYVIAQPVLTVAKKALASQTPAVTLNIVANLQSEWKAAYNQATIPAAALFVNKTSYGKYKDSIDTFIADTQSRQDDAVTDVAKVTTALNAYGDDTAVTKRFGFTSSLVTALQATNQFGILQSGVISDKKAFASDFNTTLGGSAFADSLFL
jgi:hypothetical protein